VSWEKSPGGFDRRSFLITTGNSQTKTKRFFERIAGLAAIFILLTAADGARGGDTPALTEYQVKALCLLNFTKYAEWPAGTFARADSPIAIGVVGGTKFEDGLKKAVEGKTFGGRKIVIQNIAGAEDWSKCQVLFISASEKNRFPEILDHVKSIPILTVGEADGFRKEGGIINFITKDGKVRFKINLEAARLAQLQISSKLLSLADDVTGKP
jgi:hypothetical protein